MTKIKDHVELSLFGRGTGIGRVTANERYGMKVLTFRDLHGDEIDYGHNAVFSMEHLTQEEARARYHKLSSENQRGHVGVETLRKAGFLPPTLYNPDREYADCSVYVASSWRNERQQSVVHALRDLGCWVYDFKHPQNHPEKRGFSWKEVRTTQTDQLPTMEEYKAMVSHPIAIKAYQADAGAITAADVTVLVQPCGRSTHWELGYATGMRKLTYVLLAENQEPELMPAASRLMTSLEELCEDLRQRAFNADIPF